MPLNKALYTVLCIKKWVLTNILNYSTMFVNVRSAKKRGWCIIFMLIKPKSGPKLVTILAFDPGTSNLGYSVLQGNPRTLAIGVTEYYGVFRTNKWDKGEEVPIRERIDQLGEDIKGLILTSKPELIALEDFVEQGKRVGKTYKEMSYLTEHMRLVCRTLGHEATIYSNGVWKKKTLNASSASKAQVQHYVSHKVINAHRLLKAPDHVWDSVGIGYCRWLDYLAEKRLGGMGHV